MNTPADEPLFCSGDLDATLEAQVTPLLAEVQSATEDYLLNVEVDDWVAHLVSVHRVEPLVLHRGKMAMDDLGETKVDVRSEANRAIFDRSVPAYVPGRSVRVSVPFEGDPALFKLATNPRTYSPPRAAVGRAELVKTFIYPTDTARPDIKGEMDALLNSTQQYVEWSAVQVNLHNNGLEAAARRAIAARRTRVLEDRAHLDDLGIPVRRRADAPRTYAAPGVVRKTPRVVEHKPAAPKPLEATMVQDLYHHTLSVIRSWGRAVERTPKPYRDAEEETLRDALLPMLNSHYEGAATGETFNAAGKTDILIRVEDRSIFIGECKWWSGPAAVTEALDQLLSYTTWRDSKLALIFFVDRKDPTSVLTKAREAIEGHPTFLEWIETTEERELSSRISQPGAPQITAQLAVLFVHLPQPS